MNYYDMDPLIVVAAELRLPYPPSANKIWRRAGTTMHRSKRYTNWLRDAGWLCKQQRQPSIAGKYKLSIQAKRPDKRRRDIDNIVKPISDLLVKIGIVGDDCDCEIVTARWVTSGKGIYVRVEPAGVE